MINAVEEIQDIAKDMVVSFKHVKTSVDSMPGYFG